MEKLKSLIEHAEKTIRANPGLNRMEWFTACCEAGPHRNTDWHIFKFQVALQLILSGKVKCKDHSTDKGLALFFHASHNS